LKETNSLLEEEMKKTNKAKKEMVCKQSEIQELIEASKESFTTKQNGL